ncbi:MAG: AAA family ATPase [Marinicaulis sp.]|nr:AAA family ATPase [Marinicaulis sp.]
MICDSQSQVVDFLSSPASHGGAVVQQIDTHLSHIFLTGDRAYKIKRAVRYDFVDFSSVAKRKAACELEVKVNRRTAPEIYLGVVPIYCSQKGAAWAGSGEPVDWAVEMMRFDTDEQFDTLVSRGKLDASLIKQLADKLAQFHESAEIKRDFSLGGGVASVLDQISTSLHDHEIGATRERDIARWSSLAFTEFERHAAYINARRRHGWVRHCHGDLHLANICLFKGDPTPFDAIEFNEDLAIIDVLYDIAFVSMDLVAHNRGELANLLINRYLSITRDYSGARLLRLFHSMRAGVRAMVLSLPTQPKKTKRVAERYLDLALEFLVGESELRVIAIGGHSATGKSTLAGALAMEMNHRTGAIMLRSDVVRKRLLGQTPETQLEKSGYVTAHSHAAYQRLFKDARRALRAGQSVVIDATFLDQEFRTAAEALAEKLDVPFSGVWLSAPRNVLLDRITKRMNGASDATSDVLENQLEHKVDTGGWLEVDATGSANETLQIARGMLEF